MAALRQESVHRAEWHRPIRPVLTLCDMTLDAPRPQKRTQAARNVNRALFLMAAVAVAAFLVTVSAQTVRHALVSRAPVAASQTLTVHVAKGDTLWNFASRYGDPNRYILDRVDALARVNHLPADAVLRPGQVLRIPVQNPNALAALSHSRAGRV